MEGRQGEMTDTRKRERDRERERNKQIIKNNKYKRQKLTTYISALFIERESVDL